ncbi:ABC transporter substrate-binding protein [Comamonas thiooxydans]|uniref:ABC transporter substrate-binding protein n=1 Tax=Comamonas thiooxydans TaxID=363952 RepID=UPI0005F7CA2E|nr:ABC transporter substrate-binding protein [Comamonas thiooxydans]CUB01845.1 amino acid/amide ABC transporter substrate-binding protein, HAAT family (TC 3.A.1.4.-) [Comamonas thiooxydans]
MHRIPFTARTALAGAALAAHCATGALAQDIPVVSIQAVTGAAAFAGNNYQRAIRLAVEQANSQGGINGRKINLIERDNASDKGQAINLANQAVDRDHAVLVLGPSSTADAMAVAPIFNDRKTPNLSFATSDAILKAGTWSMKFQQSPAVITPLVAKYVLEKTPVRKVALVYDRTNEALIDSKNIFRDAFKAGGGTVVAEEAIVATDANFQPLGTKLKSMDVDAVYVSALTEQSANVVVQLRQAGLGEKVRFIGSLALASPKFIAMAGKVAEGTIAVTDHIIGVDRPVNKAFEAAWKARWGAEPDSWAAIGYSLAQVGLAALKEAGPAPTREKVHEAFYRLRDVPIVGGSGAWNQTDRKPHFGAMVLVLKDGQFVVAP